jgi:outer membrane lipoprotein carrier protein
MIQVASMKKIWPVLLTLLLVLPISVRADDFEQLRRDSVRIQTISADFVQKKFMKILARPLISEGKFYYAAPSSIRWEYHKPIKSVVVSGQGNTKRYIASGGKMIEDKTGGVQAMKIVLDEVAGWMSGKFTSNPSFTATLQEGSNTQITLTPVGKSMAGMIEKIEITVSRKDASIKSVRIMESATAETRIEFQHVVINKEINPSVFRDVQ